MFTFVKNKLSFVICSVLGYLIWEFWKKFTGIDEPWDGPGGWYYKIIFGISFLISFIEGKNFWNAPIGLFFGQALFGFLSFIKAIFWYSGGGTNLFIPLGIIFLFILSTPLLIFSYLGFELRNIIANLYSKMNKITK